MLITDFSDLAIEYRDGIYVPKRADSGQSEARTAWDTIVGKFGIVRAATASPRSDIFTKFPDWIWPHLDDGMVYLDAGCGYGRVGIRILEKFANASLIGIDGAKEMLRRFVVEVRERSLDDRCFLVLDTLDRNPLKNESVDCVISSAVLLHNPYAEAENIVREFHRVLRKGGRMILVGALPNLWNLEGLQNWINVRLKPTRHGPVRPYTRRRVMKLLRGFDLVTMRANQLSLVPTKIGKTEPPFPYWVRRINRSTGPRNQDWWMRTGLLVSHFDVVATKR